GGIGQRRSGRRSTTVATRRPSTCGARPRRVVSTSGSSGMRPVSQTAAARGSAMARKTRPGAGSFDAGRVGGSAVRVDAQAVDRASQFAPALHAEFVRGRGQPLVGRVLAVFAYAAGVFRRQCGDGRAQVTLDAVVVRFQDFLV